MQDQAYVMLRLKSSRSVCVYLWYSLNFYAQGYDVRQQVQHVLLIGILFHVNGSRKRLTERYELAEFY